MKKRILALSMALILCAGLTPPALSMMSEEDFGKWIGGTDPNCQHTNTSEPYGNPPDEGDHPGTHLKVVECGDCGAQFITREECTDGNKDKKCDKCSQAMPVQATDINSASVNINTIFPDNTEYQTGTDPITPSVTVYDENGEYMYQDSDYTVDYANNTNVGTAQIILTGVQGGRLTGTRTETFNIKKFNGNLAASQNTVILFGGNNDGTFNYTGSQIKPEVMVELDGNGTLWDSCYTVKYGPNVGPGQGSVTITGTGEKAYGVSITGKRTVYFEIVKVECSHADFTYVSDGFSGHHMHCNICGTDFEIEDHDWGVDKEIDQGNEVDIYKVCGAAGCGFEWPDRTEKKLDKCPVTYPAGKSAGSEFSESEARQIGLEGLTSGEDFTTQVSSKKNDDGTESWVVELKPVQGKSRGEQVVTVKKPCLHFDFTYISDGFSGHHMHCNICGMDFEIEDHDWGVDKEIDQGNEVDIYKVCGAAGCGFEWPDRTEKKLDKCIVTYPAGKSAGSEFSESEARQIGLEGLTGGEDFTTQVSSKKNDDGTESWVVTLESVKGKTRGEQVVTVKKPCSHADFTYVSDGYPGHHMHCNICGTDFEIEDHDWGVDKEIDQGNEVDIYKVCGAAGCGFEWLVRTEKKLDKAQVGEVPAQEYTGGQIKPEPEVTLDGEQLTKGQDFTYEYGENKYPGTGEVRIVSVEGKSTGGKKITFEITEKNDPDCQHLEFVWGGNEENHWQFCNNCGHKSDPEAHAYAPEVVTAATCTQDAVIRMKCRCGKVDPNGRTAPTEGDPAEWFAHHVWGTQYESDFYEHWVTCTVCGTPGDKQTHALTNVNVLVKNDCITNGSITADCSVCGKKDMIFSSGIDGEVEMFPVLNDYKALGHDFTGPVTWFTGPKVCSQEGQGTHAATCTRCGVHDDVNKQPHNWVGLHNVQNGNCGDPNDPVIQEAACDCGATLHIEKPREHVPVEDKSRDVQATCTESGKINGHRCTICGTFYDYDFVPALGHNWVVDEKVEATCLADGYLKAHCDRCEEEKNEILKMKSPDGKHHYAPQISKQPTCTEPGTANGEKCIYCDAEQGGETGYGEIPPLGHRKKAETHKKGRIREYVTNNGVIEVTCYEVLFYCERCGHALGVEYYTVGTNPKISKYLIEPGRDVKITDLSNGIHIDGNMANDGGVYFNGEVQNAFNEVIDLAAEKYTYKKVPANSFIIEFTDEFLEEQEDGDYTLEVINGSEYWPMIVTIKDHKIVDVQPMDVPQDVPEWSMADYEAWTKQIREAGSELKELNVGCPDRKN